MISPYVFVGLKDFVIDTDKIMAEKIIDIVAVHFGMSREKILNRSRKTEIIVPRTIAIWFVSKKLSIGKEKIGEIIGGYTRRGVIKILKSANDYLDTKQENVCTHIDLISKKIDNIIFKQKNIL